MDTVELQNFNFLKIVSRWLRMSFYVQYFQELNKNYPFACMVIFQQDATFILNCRC